MSRLGSIGGRLYRGEVWQADQGLPAPTLQERDVAWFVVREARSAQSSFGRWTWRRSTATLCRNTKISTSGRVR